MIFECYKSNIFCFTNDINFQSTNPKVHVFGNIFCLNLKRIRSVLPEFNKILGSRGIILSISFFGVGISQVLEELKYC